MGAPYIYDVSHLRVKPLAKVKVSDVIKNIKIFCSIYATRLKYQSEVYLSTSRTVMYLYAL